MSEMPQRKIVAGEDLKIGDMVYINLSDGKAYPVKFYYIKHGKLGETPSAIVGQNISKNQLGMAFTSGQLTIYPSRKERLKRSIRRLWFSIRGKHYPYME